MKSRITKFAAVAVIIIAVVLSITFLDSTVTPAYAIEQSIEANHSVRYIHIKSFNASHEKPKEYWVQCNEFGKLENARWCIPEWDAPKDGAKVVVWKDDRIQLWFKGTQEKKAALVTYQAENSPEWLYSYAQQSSPGLLVEQLYEQQEKGQVTIEIDEPSDKGEPIIVTATYLPESSKAGRREVLFIDQATKLVNTIEFYKFADGQYEFQGVREYYDYNVPISPKMFNLDSEVPSNIKRIDEDLERIRLNEGINPEQLTKYENMTPKEMTIAFFQACADKDWDELVKFFTDSEVRQGTKDYYGGLEIISIGEPFTKDNYHGWYVPYEVRLKSGKVKKWNLAVRKHRLVQRYMCDGGF